MVWKIEFDPATARELGGLLEIPRGRLSNHQQHRRWQAADHGHPHRESSGGVSTVDAMGGRDRRLAALSEANAPFTRFHPPLHRKPTTPPTAPRPAEAQSAPPHPEGRAGSHTGAECA